MGNCRSKISATAYTLVGVVCKFISVLLNVAIWDKHATGTGLLMLSVCMLSSSLYQQAPMRSQFPGTPPHKTKKLVRSPSNCEKAACPPMDVGAARIGALGDSDSEEAPMMRRGTSPRRQLPSGNQLTSGVGVCLDESSPGSAGSREPK